MNAKQTAGLALLAELRGDFHENHETLAKIVGKHLAMSVPVVVVVAAVGSEESAPRVVDHDLFG